MRRCNYCACELGAGEVESCRACAAEERLLEERLRHDEAERAGHEADYWAAFEGRPVSSRAPRPPAEVAPPSLDWPPEEA